MFKTFFISLFLLTSVIGQSRPTSFIEKRVTFTLPAEWQIQSQEDKKTLGRTQIFIPYALTDDTPHSANATIVANIVPEKVTVEDLCDRIRKQSYPGMAIVNDAEGNVGSALEVYKRLWDLLDAEYDTEPSEETQRLVAVIKMGEGSPPPDPNAAAGPPRTTVSVQPRIVVTGEPPAAVGARPITSQRIVLAVGDFDIAGDVQGHGHVFPAFRRELIAQLVRFREWIVRDLSFGAGSAVPNSSEYLIEATAMVQKGAARLVVTLKNVETGDYLWSERLPIDLGAWYESMHEIVRRLSSQLNIYLSVGRMASILRQPSANLRAYDMWLKAQTRLFHWRPDEGHAAEELLKQIIAEVPDFAPAYASLASFSGNVHFYHPGFMRALERHRAARAFAEQAVRLDPIDSRAHLALGWADSYLSQFEEAVAQHDLALDLNDSDPWTLTSTALSNAFFGSREQADKLCGRAFGVSPSPSPSQWGYKGQIEFMRGEYDAAATSMEKSTSLHFGGWRAASLAFSGRKREANTALNDFFAKARERWYGTGGGSPEEIT